MPDLSQAAQEAHWYDYAYWVQNFPTVRLEPADNTHVVARTLRVPWNYADGAPPIVAVQITPRTQPAPDTGILGGADWLGLVSIIPTVGPVLSVALQIGRGLELASALKDVTTSADAYGPQFNAAPFIVPMPLDRAQIMVSRPWYAPAMVYQFSEELRTGNLRTAASAYRELTKSMLPAGTPDPPPYTHDEAALFQFVNPTAGITQAQNANGSADRNAQSAGAVTVAPSGSPGAAGVLPLVVAGGLALAGAPILLVLGVVLVLGGRKGT